MKLHYLALILASLLAPIPTLADGEQVASMVVSANLNRADVLDIHETINYDLADASPHNLIRSIPLTYTDDQGAAFLVAFKLASVTRNGMPVNPAPTITASSARLTLPVAADSNLFELHYTLSPVVMRGVTKDVFKVSFTDLNFSVPVATATLDFTAPFALGDPACSAGSSGTTNGNCDVTAAGNTVTVKTVSALGPSEALSLTGTFPRHSFTAYLGTHSSALAWVWFGLAAAVPIGLIVLVVALALRRARHRPKAVYTKDDETS